MEGFPLLHAIFFSEFHHIQGPKVVYETPEGFVRSSIGSGGSMPLNALAWQDSSPAHTVQPGLPQRPLHPSQPQSSHHRPESLSLAHTGSTSSTATVTQTSVLAHLKSLHAGQGSVASSEGQLMSASSAGPASASSTGSASHLHQLRSSMLQTGPSFPSTDPFDFFPVSPVKASIDTCDSGDLPSNGVSPAVVSRQSPSNADHTLTTSPRQSPQLPHMPLHHHTNSTGSTGTNSNLNLFDARSSNTDDALLDGTISTFANMAATAPNSHLLLDFDAISDYIIPKSDLCNRLVTLSATPPYKIVGHPVLIEHPKYERNAMLFNLCFVFDSNANTACYEQIVTKMARVLKSLEVESEFLSNPATKATVLNIIEQLLEDLNSYNECQIPINDANTINLKLFPHYPPPPLVHDYQVPVSMLNLESIMDKHWDLTMQRIIPFINGIHSVQRISYLSDVNIMLVRLAVQHLHYYGCVRLIDIFQFSNIYSVTSAVATLVSSEEAQYDCIQFVCKPNVSLPKFGVILSLYCSLKGGMTIIDWISDNREIMSSIDVRRFIVYGLLKGFVYRVHRYPILTRSVDESRLAIDTLLSRNRRLLDGQHHFDDICTKLQISAKDLNDRLTHLGTHFILS